jgi:hypothetical protein
MAQTVRLAEIDNEERVVWQQYGNVVYDKQDWVPISMWILAQG